MGCWRLNLHPASCRFLNRLHINFSASVKFFLKFRAKVFINIFPLLPALPESPLTSQRGNPSPTLGRQTQRNEDSGWFRGTHLSTNTTQKQMGHLPLPLGEGWGEGKNNATWSLFFISWPMAERSYSALMTPRKCSRIKLSFLSCCFPATYLQKSRLSTTKQNCRSVKNRPAEKNNM